MISRSMNIPAEITVLRKRLDALANREVPRVTAITIAPGKVLALDGSLTVEHDTTLRGGGTLDLAGKTITAPSSGTIALRDIDNVFTVGQTIQTAGATDNTTTVEATESGAAILRVRSALGSTALIVDRPAGQTGDLDFTTAGSIRFRWRLSSAAESGSDAGSNISLIAYHDDGTTLGTVASITRATRNVVFGGIISSSNINVAFVGGAGTAALRDTSNTFTNGTQTIQPATGASTLVVRSNDAGATIAVSSVSGQVRDIVWRTGTSDRWTARVTNTAESGSDVGSDWQLISRTDSGTVKATILSIVRSTGVITVGGQITMADAKDFAVGTGTGTKIGTATTQKIAFHNAPPVVQRSGAAQAAVATTAATNTTPYGFTTAAQADGIITLLNELRASLVEKGLIKGSS